MNRRHKRTMSDLTRFYRPAEIITPEHEIATEDGWRRVLAVHPKLVDGRELIQFALEGDYEVDPVQPTDGLYSRVARTEGSR